MKNCILAGVGGQGTVLASKMIAACAMRKGYKARTAETIGMAQRGGCVVSHVRLGDEAYSPLIPYKEADLIIGFEPAEAVRNLPYLKEGGTIVVSDRAVKPTTDAFSCKKYDGKEMLDYLKSHVHTIIVDTDGACREAGSYKALNMALLGAAAAAGVLGIQMQELQEAVRERMPEKFHRLNIRALEAGAGHMRVQEDDRCR